MILALAMEREFSKRQILEAYLNEIYLGSGNYGVAQAAMVGTLAIRRSRRSRREPG